MSTTGQSTEPVAGERVLDWLASDEARAFAGRWAGRRGLPADASAVDDLIADAQVAVLTRSRAGAFTVDNPAAYGTQVIKSIVRQTLQGHDRDRAVLDATVGARPEPRPGVRRIVLEADRVAFGDDREPESTIDDLRVIIEVMQDPSRPWLTGAALAFVALAVGDSAVPPGVPQPKSGATPAQARGWAALWFAGVRDLFPGPDGDPAARRRRRSRYVDKVLDHLQVAAERYRAEQREVTDA